MTDETDQLRATVIRLAGQLQRAEAERDAALRAVSEQADGIEGLRDMTHAAWRTAEIHQERGDLAIRLLEDERRHRDALVELEVERLTSRPLRAARGRPSAWTVDAENEVERRYRGGQSVRALAADLDVSPTHVHRIIKRVRGRQRAAQERARLVALADGRSPGHRDLAAAERAVKGALVEPHDPDRADRGMSFIDRYESE